MRGSGEGRVLVESSGSSVWDPLEIVAGSLMQELNKSPINEKTKIDLIQDLLGLF
jgi:hypothetical protein